MELTRRALISVLAGAGAWGALSGCTGSPELHPALETPTGPHAPDWLALVGPAVAQVTGLWGTGAIAVAVRLAAPADPADFARRTGHAQTEIEVPAVTVGSGTAAVIVVHPHAWDRLTPAGRLAVLTHEVTHLAMQGDGPVPGWLGEGLAEFTAHHRSDPEPLVVAGSALDGVRAGRLPTTWPDPLAVAETGRWTPYAMSWLACLFLAREWTPQHLLRLYHVAAGGGSMDAAMRDVLGASEPVVLAAWVAWLPGIARA